MARARVAAVIVRDGRVLMVRERALNAEGRHEGVEYWTLPGGGVEAGETLEAAVIREVQEEVVLVATAPRFAFRFPYVNGWTDAFVVDTDGTVPVMGVEDLECDCPRIVGLDWIALPERSELNALAIPTLLVVGDGRVVD